VVYRGEFVVGGGFESIGGIDAWAIASWNGERWKPLGEGLRRGVYAGNTEDFWIDGDDLIVAGDFDTAGGEYAPSVAIWDGTRWRALGDEAFDLGVNRIVQWNGELVAGGTFRYLGSEPCRFLAHWTGARWELMATLDGQVNDLAEYEGDLLVAGRFDTIDGVAVNHLARYDGASWQSIGGGLGGASVSGVWVDGSDLWVWGAINEDDPYHALQRWDGVSWSTQEEIGRSFVHDVMRHEGELYLGGAFRGEDSTVPVHAVMKKVDGAWEPVGGVFRAQHWFGDGVFQLVEYGDEFIGVGSFAYAGDRYAAGITRWDGVNWAPFCGGYGIDDDVFCAGVYQGQVVVGGRFNDAGCTQAARVAIWDGSGWQSLGADFSRDLASGPMVWDVVQWGDDLIVVGEFDRHASTPMKNVARWDGVSWYDIGGGIYKTGTGSEKGFSACVYEGQLVVGGGFDHAGPLTVLSVAMWDGVEWSSLGFEDLIETGPAEALAVYDGDLIVAGEFLPRGGSGVVSVARYDGSTWSPMGGEFADFGGIFDMAVIGGELYITGNFQTIGGETIYGITRWNGTRWVPLGMGLSYPGLGLTAYNGDLVVVGTFSVAGEVRCPGIGRWDGQRWWGFGSGFQAPAQNWDVTTVDGDLYVVGEFTNAGEQFNHSFNIARWRDPVTPIEPVEVRGERMGSGVRLSWVIRDAVTDRSFHVLRAAAGGTRQPITRESIAAVAGSFRDESAPRTALEYWLLEVGLEGATYGPVVIAPLRSGSADAAVLRVMPNPTSRGARIHVDVEPGTEVRLLIVDAQGRAQRLLASRSSAEGIETILWDGRDDRGRDLPPGTYFIQLRVGGEHPVARTEKLVLAP
jgi:hypothetical protein